MLLLLLLLLAAYQLRTLPLHYIRPVLIVLSFKVIYRTTGSCN
jgi:hypothetical protein